MSKYQIMILLYILWMRNQITNYLNTREIALKADLPKAENDQVLSKFGLSTFNIYLL